MAKVLHGEILGPELTPEEEAARAERVRKKFWSTFRKAVRFIPFSDEVVAAYYCAFDPATPHRVRAVILGALAYFVLPVDAVPDFLAGNRLLRRRDGAPWRGRPRPLPHHAGP